MRAAIANRRAGCARVRIGKRRINWILDADIQSFFDTVSQEWLIRFIEHRVGDRQVVRLIRKWLAAGVLEDGQVIVTEEGTPQGAVADFRCWRTSIFNTSTISGSSTGDNDPLRAGSLSSAMRMTPLSASSIGTKQSSSLQTSRCALEASAIRSVRSTFSASVCCRDRLKGGSMKR